MYKKIRIIYTMTAPVSHIGETSSTGAYFQTVLTANGRLPIITGNAMRGILRDCAAMYLLDRVGCKVDKEVFNILFSGGNINGTMKNDVAKAKAVRSTFPIISLFGGGLGDMIMQGKLITGNLYPLCVETEEMLGIQSGGISWHNLIDEIEMTRMDDTKDDTLEKYIKDVTAESKAKASTQMRFSVQYMAVGTVFVQDIILADCSETEEGVFYSALAKWFEKPILGGMGAKGFGTFSAQSDDDDIVVENGMHYISPEIESLITGYDEFIEANISEESFNILIVKGAK